VQVVDVELLPDPEIVQTGSPPFLKCPFAAFAAVAVSPATKCRQAEKKKRSRGGDAFSRFWADR
jgi:hypothetical protein